MKRYIDIYLWAALFLMPAHVAAAERDWRLVYEDNYDYASQKLSNTTFNTWFWREDSVGRHTFDFVDSDKGCSARQPCVVLTAPHQPRAQAYINAEMYNNPCVKQGVGQYETQSYDALSQNPWSVALQGYVKRHCDMPYPYRTDPTAAAVHRYADSGWNTTTGARLEANPLAFTRLDAEPSWQAVRDLTFNNLYSIDGGRALRMTAKIRAEGEAGGSRGWGFWNTSLDPAFWQLAWFMEYSTQNDRGGDVRNSVVMQTMTFSGPGKIGICSTKLPHADFDIYGWHDYRIELSALGVSYFVDGRWVVTHSKVVPTGGMAFHNWVDNRNYFGGKPANFPMFVDKSNYISAYRIEDMAAGAYRPPEGVSPYAAKCAVVDAEDSLIKTLEALVKDN